MPTTDVRRWTKEELDILIKEYPSNGIKYCANLLSRTDNSIRIKANKLGLKTERGRGGNKLSDAEYTARLIGTDYEHLEPYTLSSVKILHRHKKCGHEWKVLPASILRGYNCPICAGINIEGSCILYYVYFEEINLYKIGITGNWKNRKSMFGYKPIVLFMQEYDSFSDAYVIEQNLLDKLSRYLINTNLLNAGNTETFRFDKEYPLC